MRLTYRQIEFFHAVMAHRIVTEAAEWLGSSQPTVSREIGEMERQIGFPLFQRFGRRLTPTYQGEALFETVRQVHFGLDEINRTVEALASGLNGALCIACLPAYAESLIPMVLPVLRTQGIGLSVHALEEPILKGELSSRLFDIALTEGSYVDEDEVADRLEPGNLVAILPAGHPLTSKPALSPGDFEGENFINFNREDPYRRRIDKIFASEGVKRHLIIEATTATSIRAMVATGAGVSIINPLTACFHRHAGLAVRPLTLNVPYRINVLRPVRSRVSRVVGVVLERLRQACDEVAAADWLNVGKTI